VWCTSCKEQTPIVEELEREYEGRVIFLEIDADEYPGLLKNYNPFGYLPTIVIFDNKGAEEQTYIGVVEKEELEKVISNILP
jgi:thioredoxin 1